MVCYDVLHVYMYVGGGKGGLRREGGCGRKGGQQRQGRVEAGEGALPERGSE
jgi:hypothetical protein